MNARYSLPSEQIPNDGGYHLPRLIKEANDRLKTIGKHGKRATIKVTAKFNKPISAQFSLPNIGQKQYGLDLPLNRNNLIKAEQYCTLITSHLVAGTFTEDWFNSLIGKESKNEAIEQELVLTCQQMLEQYKIHYFKQQKDNKDPDANWYDSSRYIEKILSQYDSPITLKIVREIIDCTENNSTVRNKNINGLVNLLKHFDNNEFKAVIKKYKSDNKPKSKNKHIPDDREIMNVYKYGFKIDSSCRKTIRYRYAQWQFLYSLLAVYGLRVHEAWHIKNWNCPVTLKDGDWLAINDDAEDIEFLENEDKYVWQKYQGNGITIPAILDPTNTNYLLCIGHETKTGYRIAFPLSPNGHNWVKEFNLIQPFNLPDLKNPLKSRGKYKGYGLACSVSTCQWFRDKKYGFTPHALRHSYNIRGHKLGVNQKVLCNSLGHGLRMNSSTYLRHEGDRSKLEGILQEVSKDKDKRNEVETLKAENKQLKLEVERLRTELAMLKAIAD